MPTVAHGADAWALIIGVKEYAFKPEENNLTYPEKDATELRATLIEKAGFQQDHIRLLLSKQATKAAIKAGFLWLAQNAKKDDLVLVYFSGHGSYLPDPRELDGYATCLVDYTVSCIRGDEVIAALSPIASTQKILITDSCFSAGIVRALANHPEARTRDLKAAPWVKEDSRQIYVRPYIRPSKDPQLVSKTHVPKSGLLVLAASRFNQKSWELPELEHGVFTYFLLQGLSGGAKDLNNDSYLSAVEVFKYIDEQLALVRYGENPMLKRFYFGDVLQEPALIRGAQAKDIQIMKIKTSSVINRRSPETAGVHQ